MNKLFSQKKFLIITIFLLLLPILWTNVWTYAGIKEALFLKSKDDEILRLKNYKALHGEYPQNFPAVGYYTENNNSEFVLIKKEGDIEYRYCSNSASPDCKEIENPRVIYSYIDKWQKREFTD